MLDDPTCILASWPRAEESKVSKQRKSRPAENVHELRAPSMTQLQWASLRRGPYVLLQLEALQAELKLGWLVIRIPGTLDLALAVGKNGEAALRGLFFV